jgi:hypothetical protein
MDILKNNPKFEQLREQNEQRADSDSDSDSDDDEWKRKYLKNKK